MRTGIDFDKLIAVRDIIAKALPDDEIYGHLASAGLPKGFKSAAVA
jgi:hydroxymethylglutaryl-CoA lyase